MCTYMYMKIILKKVYVIDQNFLQMNIQLEKLQSSTLLWPLKHYCVMESVIADMFNLIKIALQ